MDTFLRTLLWHQFGAAIDMLENALRSCPEQLWGDRDRQPEFWYITYHTLFWLDFYLSEQVAGFAPPPPFTLDEMDPAGLMPPRVYTQAELQHYLEHGREKCRVAISELTDAQARARCGFDWLEMSVLETHLYNLRHVQHHAAQLNLLLRQTIDTAPRWVGKTRTGLSGFSDTNEQV